MHLRPTHFPASLNTIDINLKRAGIDLVDSTEHRISCDVKSAIYKSVFLSGLEISLLSSDCMIPLLKDINITGEFAIDLRSTEDRWPECEVIVAENYEQRWILRIVNPWENTFEMIILI